MEDEKGFTLVELLATLAVLAILMLLAVPNVIGIVQRNKNKAYIEDAKKLVTLAQYKISSNPDIKPKKGVNICFYLSYLDKSKELDEPPNGGEYKRYLSYVQVTNTNGQITYNVQLAEQKGSTSMGISKTSSTNLFDDSKTASLTKNAPSTQCTGSLYYYDKDSNPSTTPIKEDGGSSYYYG